MRLTEHVHLVGGGARGMGISHDADCNIYLVTDGNDAAIIDAGAGSEPELILANIASDGIPKDRIKYLILTHCHGDHAGGAAGLKQALDLEVITPQGTKSWLETPDENAMHITRARAAGRYAPDYQFTPVEVAREVADGDVIQIGSLQLEVFSTPGHAPIHNAYLLRESNRTSLFSRDLVFSGGAVSIIWSPDTSVFDMGESIGRFREMDIHALYPGHDDISLSGGQRHIDAALARFDNLVVPHSMLLD